MKILLILIGMLLICYSSGKCLSFIVSGRNRRFVLSPHIGYAYVLISFYGLYEALHSPNLAAFATLGLPAAIAAVIYLTRLLRREPAAKHLVSAPPILRNDLLCPALAAILVTAFAIWPYLLCGWGNYWHSGNYDMEDGLNGRDAYLQLKLFDRTFDTGKASGDSTSYEFAKATGSLTKPDARTYRDWYAGDGFRLQYSSVAFWSLIFRESYGLDILLEQMLLNLVLMCLAVYWLCRDAFLLRPLASSIAAASPLVSFYFTTFLAGHEGSLMYGALLPAFLYLVLAKPAEALPWFRTGIYCALLLSAIAYSYPHPLAIIIPPVLLYKLWDIDSIRVPVRRIYGYVSRTKLSTLLAFFICAVALVLLWISLWHVTEAYRIRQADQYRAWGYTRDWLILPLYLGLMRPPMDGSAFLGAQLGPSAYWAWIGVSALLSGMLALAYYRSAPAANRGFLSVFGLTWLFMYCVFRFAIQDSYYLYKFLYTHQFIFVVGTVGYLATKKSRVMKAACAAVLLVNLLVDVSTAASVYNRPFNHESREFAFLYGVDHDVLRKSFVDITGGEAVAIRELLKAQGVETSLDARFADYFIVPASGETDITGAQFAETVARAGPRFSIKRAPAANYLMVRTTSRHSIGEPERAPLSPDLRGSVFRWVASGRNDNLGIYVIRPNLALAGRYLRVCLQNGPSAPGPLTIGISTAARKVLAKVELDGVRCAWIPAEEAVGGPQPLMIRSGAQGKSLLPFDDRILLYRIFAVGWATRPYDDRALEILNLAEDIVRSEGPGAGEGVRLGQGWQPYESYGGDHFRWAGKGAEIVLEGREDTAISLTVEPGPGQGVRPMILWVEDSDHHQVFRSGELRARATLEFTVPGGALERRVYTLRTNSQHLRIPSDPRILDYRVFKLTASVRSGAE